MPHHSASSAPAPEPNTKRRLRPAKALLRSAVRVRACSRCLRRRRVPFASLEQSPASLSSLPIPGTRDKRNQGERGDPKTRRKAQNSAMAYSLPPLPYDYGALEPHIDTETMQIHHDKHHATYVKNLNAAVEKFPELKDVGIVDLNKAIGTSKIPSDVATAVRQVPLSLLFIKALGRSPLAPQINLIQSWNIQDKALVSSPDASTS